MIARIRDLAARTHGRVRQAVLVLFALGLLWALSGARPLLLAVIVIALIAAYRVIDREQREQRQASDHAPPTDDDLDYEDSLEVLLGMVGRDVNVLLIRTAGTPPGVSHMEGVLRSVQPDTANYRLIDRSYDGHEVLFVNVSDVAGFWLPRRDFVTAVEVATDGKVGIDLQVGELIIGVYDRQASELSTIRMEDRA